MRGTRLTEEAFDWLEQVVAGGRGVGHRDAQVVECGEVTLVGVGLVGGGETSALEAAQRVGPRLVGAVYQTAVEPRRDLIELPTETNQNLSHVR